MASVCGGSLALMDAGVPIKAHVAGIAMGLIKEGNRFAVLTDILGDEDHLGDMDFKVAGTDNGITALQMDIKIEGITKEIMQVALAQAREGRMLILEQDDRRCCRRRAPNFHLSRRASSRSRSTRTKIRDVIGKGGAVIRALTEETGTTIDIEDDGTVSIACISSEGGGTGEKAHRGDHRRRRSGQGLRRHGAEAARLRRHCQRAAGQGRPAAHLADQPGARQRSVADHLKEGQVVKVKVLEADDKGRLRLSMKAVERRRSSRGAVKSQGLLGVLFLALRNVRH